jgi:hypothetical protein
MEMLPLVIDDDPDRHRLPGRALGLPDSPGPV